MQAARTLAAVACNRERLPWVTAAIAGLATAVFALGITPATLAYRPAAPTWLAALTCHLVHFSPLHFRWDLSTFVLVSVVSEWRDRRSLVWFLLCAGLLVPPLACGLERWVGSYAGLSGLVVGQVAMWLTRELRRHGRRAAPWILPLIALLLAKQLYEYAIGHTLLVQMDYQAFRSVPAAHLVSTLIGITIGVASARDQLVSGVPPKGASDTVNVGGRRPDCR